ncbi:hypothetical protein HDU97_005875 [Phlyctochytrium planicorne]|nr:hypothetical protein HDU97_005875 [Phlyctochytrium planicorne]
MRSIIAFLLLPIILLFSQISSAEPCNSTTVYEAADKQLLPSYPCLFDKWSSYYSRDYCKSCNVAALIASLAPAIQSDGKCAGELTSLLIRNGTAELQTAMKAACADAWKD